MWLPGTAHGYHGCTFGFLLDELVRRIAGNTLSQYWREAFAQPLNLDLWIGLPEPENPRVATIYAAKGGRLPEPKNHQSASDFYLDLVTPVMPGTQVTPPLLYGLQSVSGMYILGVRAQPIVSFGAVYRKRIGTCEVLIPCLRTAAKSVSEPSFRKKQIPYG